MPYTLIVLLLLAALFVVCTCAAAGWNLDREIEAGEPEAQADAPQAPLPRPDEEYPLQDLRGPLSGLGERLGNVAAKFRTMADTNQQLSTQIKSRTSQLHQAQAEIGRLKDERERRLAEQVALAAQLQERQQELDRGAAHARSLELELARARERSSARMGELEARVAGGQLELAQHSEALASAERRVAELEAGARVQSGELLEARRIEQELRQELGERSAAVRSASELERSLAARIIALEAQLARRDAELQQQAQEQRDAEDHASARIAALEAQLAQRDAELQQRAQEQFQAELRATDRVGALESQLARREAELEQGALEQRQAEARALGREEAHSARIGALESRLAQRDAELAQRDAELAQQTQERRQAEARNLEREEEQSALSAALESRLARRDAEVEQRNAELAQRDAELAQQARELRQAEDRASEREQAQSARIVELEQELAQRAAELHEHTTELEGLLQEIVVQSSVGDERARRCAALEEELRQRVEEQSRGAAELRERATELEALRAELARAGSQGGALARHCAELEERLRVREEQLRALHGDCLALAEGGAAREAALEARAEELRERDRHMARQDARVSELEYSAEQRAAQHRADLASIDEIAVGRISSVLDGTAGASPVPLPEAYLAGIEQRDLASALCGLLGGPEPLSAPAALRLAEYWREQHAASKYERIEGQVVYLWADAPFVRTGLEPEGTALLVIVAGLSDGTRRVLSVDVAARDSESAWLSALEELVRRGMNVPRLVVGEDGLGVWPALASLGWNCAQQRCWDRRIEHVVDALPKRQQRLAGEQLRKLAKAKTRAEANRMKDAFVARHRKRRPEAVARIQADWEQMVGLYSFPADHWPHLRTTAVVESLLSPLRLQTSLPKPGAPTPHASSILWKLLLVGARGLRKLNSPELLPAVAAAERCVDGVLGGKSRKRAA
jgi:hypothetical protein